MNNELFGWAFVALGAVATGSVLARALRRPQARAAWLVLAIALAANLGSDALSLFAAGGGGLVEGLGTGLGAAAFPLSLAALALMLAARIGRLRPIAWLDGLSVSFCLQTLLALIVLAPAAMAAGSDDSLALVFPLADLLVVGIVAAAWAEGGWRLDGWVPILIGLALFTVGDSLSAAQMSETAGGPDTAAALLWLAGGWSLAVAAWAPTPRFAGDVEHPRGWVPVIFSFLALALLVVAALGSDRWAVTMGLAAAGMVVVTLRFALTLRLNARVLGRSRREASVDALTGLANRRQLNLDLEEALADCDSSRPSALGLFDLNGFKAYNDTYGHPAGDALLETLGGRLTEAVAGSAKAYRMGGDEFCILVDTGARESSRTVLDRAAAALCVATRDIEVSAAAGLVVMPDEAATASDALRLADLRMYENKNQGRVGPARQVAQTLMLALEERNLGTSRTGIGQIAAAVGERLGVDSAEVERIRLGVLLRNVGKIAIPDSILDKPLPLDENEQRLIRRHPQIGQRIIEAAPILTDVAGVVRSSAERVDGSGYPDGLAGEEIPLAARIAAVCGAYEAMISERAYRQSLDSAAALAELWRCAGTQFDPPVVEAFAAVLAEDPEPAVVPLSIQS